MRTKEEKGGKGGGGYEEEGGTATGEFLGGIRVGGGGVKGYVPEAASARTECVGRRMEDCQEERGKEGGNAGGPREPSWH